MLFPEWYIYIHQSVLRHTGLALRGVDKVQRHKPETQTATKKNPLFPYKAQWAPWHLRVQWHFHRRDDTYGKRGEVLYAFSSKFEA